jgi:hypothetical protein
VDNNHVDEVVMSSSTANDKGTTLGPTPDAGPPTGATRQPIVSYSRGEWGTAPDPVQGDGLFVDEMSAAGYSHLYNHGSEHSAVWLEVFEHRDGGTHIVCINNCSRYYSILVPDVLSLFQLLGELLPVVEASHRLEAVEEEYERRFKEERRRHAG